MPFDEALADRIRCHFESRGIAFEAKPMMGCLCFMVDGKMCVAARQSDLMLRLDPEQRDAHLQEPGCRPMELHGRRMKGFVWVSLDVIESEKEFQRWMQRALDFNPQAKASPKSKRPRR
ncbi:MAG: TfoX/Sxy family protein [Verrucomicrobiales bacterium]|nr:TfoX/Sxy family protein [Verrucomicrobiales bacterium]